MGESNAKICYVHKLWIFANVIAPMPAVLFLVSKATHTVM